MASCDTRRCALRPQGPTGEACGRALGVVVNTRQHAFRCPPPTGASSPVIFLQSWAPQPGRHPYRLGTAPGPTSLGEPSPPSRGRRVTTRRPVDAGAAHENRVPDVGRLSEAPARTVPQQWGGAAGADGDAPLPLGTGPLSSISPDGTRTDSPLNLDPHGGIAHPFPRQASATLALPRTRQPPGTSRTTGAGHRRDPAVEAQMRGELTNGW